MNELTKVGLAIAAMFFVLQIIAFAAGIDGQVFAITTNALVGIFGALAGKKLSNVKKQN